MADTTTTPPAETKNVLQSVTVQGLIITLLPLILKVFHIDLAPGWDDALKDLISEGTTVLGAGIAYWGRLRASSKLVVLPKK